jgi:hypothetical protein
LMFSINVFYFDVSFHAAHINVFVRVLLQLEVSESI